MDQYNDLLANVRHDGEFHSIKSLVQPWDYEVKEAARIFAEKPDPIRACQDFVHSFPAYRREIGDYWSTPNETMEREYGDCDCKAILLCSLLRNFYFADEVFCAFGTWNGGGHMWVLLEKETGGDRIIESTAPSSAIVRGHYDMMAMFNDHLAFASPRAIKQFDLIPVVEGAFVYA